MLPASCVGRRLLARGTTVLEVDVPDESILLDVDRPEDYARDRRALEEGAG